MIEHTMHRIMTHTSRKHTDVCMLFEHKTKVGHTQKMSHTYAKINTLAYSYRIYYLELTLNIHIAMLFKQTEAVSHYHIGAILALNAADQ